MTVTLEPFDTRDQRYAPFADVARFSVRPAFEMGGQCLVINIECRNGADVHFYTPNAMYCVLCKD